MEQHYNEDGKRASNRIEAVDEFESVNDGGGDEEMLYEDYQDFSGRP